MNRGRITVIASIFTPVAIGLTIGLAAQSGSASAGTRDAATGSASSTHTAATTALTASATAPKFILLGCNNDAEVAPSGISNCGDGAAGLTSLHWTSWTSHLASGYGTYFLNDCTPTCAGGHFHTYPALVVLWGSAAVKGHPSERKYTQMTLVFTGTRPPVYQVVNGKTLVTHPVTLTLPTFP
jgi:uncharacterized lipoprotein NlpE involved in copper resistance